MVDDSVCFLCKDGGTLVVCDHKKCSKVYHAECLGQELDFFRRGRWLCGRHFCTTCTKPPSKYCVMCPASFCTSCRPEMNISVEEFLPLTYIPEQPPPQSEHRADEYGLCKACLRIVKMIELNHTIDEHGNEIDFEDSTTVEFLFKEYWIMLKINCGYKLPSFFSGSYLGNSAPPHPVLVNLLQKEQVNGIHELNCFSRSQLLQLLDDPFKLTAAIVGGFVRVRVINKEGNSHHRLVQVIGTVLQSEYYEVGKQKTNVLIEVLNVNRRQRIKINLVSDRLSQKIATRSAEFLENDPDYGERRPTKVRVFVRRGIESKTTRNMEAQTSIEVRKGETSEDANPKLVHDCITLGEQIEKSDSDSPPTGNMEAQNSMEEPKAETSEDADTKSVNDSNTLGEQTEKPNSGSPPTGNMEAQNSMEEPKAETSEDANTKPVHDCNTSSEPTNAQNSMAAPKAETSEDADPKTVHQYNTLSEPTEKPDFDFPQTGNPEAQNSIETMKAEASKDKWMEKIQPSIAKGYKSYMAGRSSEFLESDPDCGERRPTEVRVYVRRHIKNKTTRNMVVQNSVEVRKAETSADADPKPGQNYYTLSEVTENPDSYSPSKGNREAHNSMEMPKAETSEDADTKPLHECNTDSKPMEKGDSGSPSRGHAEAQNCMVVPKAETSEDADPKTVPACNTLGEVTEKPNSDSPPTGNRETQNSMEAAKAEASEDADTKLVHECNALGGLKAKPDSGSPPTDGVDPLPIFKCGRDPRGTKSRICIASESCRRNPRWFQKKKGIEAHLLKEHGIKTLLPRGLKIVEEKQLLEGKDCGASYFSHYERERSFMRFLNAETKYTRSRQSFQRKLQKKALDRYNAIPESLRTGTESDFVQKFCYDAMAIYDTSKDQRIEKIQARVAKGYESYCRAHGWQTTENHGNISCGRQMNPQTNSQPTVRKTNNQLLRKEVDAAQGNFVMAGRSSEFLESDPDCGERRPTEVRVYVRRRMENKTTRNMVVQNSMEVRKAETSADADPNPVHEYYTLGEITENPDSYYPPKGNREAHNSMETPKAETSEDADTKPLHECNTDSKPMEKGDSGSPSRGHAEAQNCMVVPKAETSEDADLKTVPACNTLGEVTEKPNSDSPPTGNRETQNSMEAAKAEASEDADTKLVHECNALGGLKAKPDSGSPPTDDANLVKLDGVDPLPIFKCGRDPRGTKSRICIASESCRRNPRWFQKKKGLEAHLLKEHGIKTLLPRGLKIVEEKQLLEGKDCGAPYFSNYERDRSFMRFLNAETKYTRSRQSFQRKLQKKALDRYNAIPEPLRIGTESDFVQKFCYDAMAIYDTSKDQRIEKIQSRIAKGYESYCRAHGWQTTENHGHISSGRQMNLRKEVDAAQRDFVMAARSAEFLESDPYCGERRPTEVRVYVRRRIENNTTRNMVAINSVEVRKAETSANADSKPVHDYYTLGEVTENPYFNSPPKDNREAHNSMETPKAESSEDADIKPLHECNIVSKPTEKPDSGSPSTGNAEAQNCMVVPKAETSEDADPKMVPACNTLGEVMEKPNSDSPPTGNREAQNSMEAAEAEASEDGDAKLVRECNAPGGLKAKPDSGSPPTDGVDPLPIFKCGRDPRGTKCRICIASESCRKNPRWFHKKKEIEAHLLKEHGIKTLLPRGLKIVEEKQLLEGKCYGASYFSNYERERSCMRFLNAETKYTRSRQSFQRKLRKKALDRYNAIPEPLRTGTESDFVQKFCDDAMAIYDTSKDQRIEKIQARIAKGYESYCRAYGWQTTENHGNMPSGR